MNVGRIAKTLYMTMVFSFLYVPIIILIVYSFNSGKYSTSAWGGFTLEWYARLFNNKALLSAMINSLLVAVTSASIATVIGTVGAVSFFRFNYIGKNLNLLLLYVVMMSPDIVMGIALLVLFISLKMPLGFSTLLITHVTFSLPFVIVTLSTRLAGFDKHIVEAAKDLGADEFKTFRYILLPLLMPAIAAGWLLSFTISMDDAIGSFFVTGPSFETLPLRIFSMVRLGVKPDINALSTIIFVFSLILVIIAQLLLREKKHR